MSTTALKPPIDRLITAVNSGDMDGFLATFAYDGVVDDWGRRFTGHNEIRGWSERESIGLQQTFAVDSTREEGDTVVAVLQVGGNGFNGPSTFTFTLDGDLIREMKITA